MRLGFEVSPNANHGGLRPASVEVILPVCGDGVGRAGNRLVERMVLRRSELGSLHVVIGRIVVEPVLVRLEGADDWVTGRRSMMTGVLGR
jgi:hypothetical protein